MAFTVWLTGLPGAGKSTISSLLTSRLADRGVAVARLDGDEVRREALYNLGFSRSDRDTNIRVIGFVAATLNRHGVPAVVSVISPYRETRAEVRKKIDRFIEVYVRCPVEVCIQRDPKGLYKKALAGEISGMTGLDDPYEEPEEPEIVVSTDKYSAEECADQILAYLEQEDLV
jgi:adenylylsulfate kinase